MRTCYEFTTGNSVEVSYDPECGLRMEWTRWPVSQLDITEWREVRRDLIAMVLPPGIRFALVDEDTLGCAGCDDE